MPPVMSLHDSRARAERAFQLRAIGWSWRQIAGELGYRSVGAAQTAVERHEKRNEPESADKSRRALVESARLTTRVLFDRFAAAADRGDDHSLALINRELRGNRDQLARLLGAYAPERSEVDVTVHQTQEQILADTRARLSAAIDAEVVDVKEISQ